MKIQVNRKHYIDLENISHLVEKRGQLYVYKKIGYPHAIIASCKLTEFLMRIANAGGNFYNITIITE